MKYDDTAVELLKSMISIQSFSKEEEGTANLLEDFFKSRGMDVFRKTNNIWVRNKYFNEEKPTILLNSHHDTVKPNSAYTKDPLEPSLEEGKLYGLGSNDAGASLVSLIVTFLHFSDNDLPYNLIMAATAEEEISGKNGIVDILTDLEVIDFAIVGEPTSMQMAIAEKGLLVLDCESKGEAGHAARSEGVNAIYEAMKDIKWFETYEFAKLSPSLGKVHMNVTQIEAGKQHNVVPDKCRFVVDIRVTDAYTHEEILQLISGYTHCEINPRSTRLKSSGIDKQHPLVVAGSELGLETYGSPTLSDQALMPFDSIKLGPGDSERSHSANEFVYLKQIDEGIEVYIKLLERLFKMK